MDRALRLLAAAALLTAPTSALADAAAIFQARCVTCHGADGKAQTPVGRVMKAADLTSPAVQGLDAAAMAKVILENPKHHAFASTLSAEDAAALAILVKGLAG